MPIDATERRGHSVKIHVPSTVVWDSKSIMSRKLEKRPRRRVLTEEEMWRAKYSETSVQFVLDKVEVPVQVGCVHIKGLG